MITPHVAGHFMGSYSIIEQLWNTCYPIVVVDTDTKGEVRIAIDDAVNYHLLAYQPLFKMSVRSVILDKFGICAHHVGHPYMLGPMALEHDTLCKQFGNLQRSQRCHEHEDRSE
jgi:hypothetical protein